MRPQFGFGSDSERVRAEGGVSMHASYRAEGEVANIVRDKAFKSKD